MTSPLLKRLFVYGLARNSIVNLIYWRLKFGEKIQLEWPGSRDPNKEWRSWLESNVGRQGLDWDWRVVFSSGFNIEIKFRKKKYASQFILMFS